MFTNSKCRIRSKKVDFKHFKSNKTWVSTRNRTKHQQLQRRSDVSKMISTFTDRFLKQLVKWIAASKTLISKSSETRLLRPKATFAPLLVVAWSKTRQSGKCDGGQLVKSYFSTTSPVAVYSFSGLRWKWYFSDQIYLFRCQSITFSDANSFYWGPSTVSAPPV